MNEQQPKDESTLRGVATFGGGCFWCTEAIFNQIEGVIKVEPGYSGGKIVNPTYKQVCTGRTGHAEAVQITFDPKVISYQDLLEIFFATHDPTTLNRQGNDFGTQYKSVIFFHNNEQQSAARTMIEQLNKAKVFNGPIVTEIKPFKAFYIAEDYHRNYFNRQPNEPYCRAVISPKIAKFRKRFTSKLKENAKPM